MSCVNVDTDPNETGAATAALAEFDPGKSIIPFPNNLLLDRATGKVAIPAQCGESPLGQALREGVLNALDGFGTFKSAMRVTFTEPVDVTTLEANVKMYRRATGTTPADPNEEKNRPVPLVFIPGKTVRFSADCSSNATVDSVTIVPRIALTGRSTYSVAVFSGVKATSGATFEPSSTWGLVRQSANPVTIEDGQIVSERTALNPGVEADRATLLGLDLLWKAHANPIASSPGHHWPAARGDHPCVGVQHPDHDGTARPDDRGHPGGEPAQGAGQRRRHAGGHRRGTVGAHMQGVLTAFGAPADLCTTLNCAGNVSAVLNGTVTAPNYQTPSGNVGFPTGGPIPSVWSSPLTPTKISDAALTVRMFVPAGTRPATGWPTIVFGHGLGGGKEFSYFVATQLAAQGFATAAIDFVASSSRAVRISDKGACAGTPSPLALPQCFAPILSTNVAATRDNLRQSVLDVQTLVQSLKACTVAAPCGGLAVDSAKIGYMGISLGGIIGATVVASDPTIKASVLNVPAPAWSTSWRTRTPWRSAAPPSTA
ncbi:MAG: hypothetical protein HC863_00395 [Myxococcales bacterium]|nr:hypothetical protein [Myxococcales bacterium]